MKRELIERKAKRAIAKYRTEIQARYRTYKLSTRIANRRPRCVTRYERAIKSGQPFSLTYRTRTCEFANYKRSCVIDLVNETGHSYGWWRMLRRINGVLYLNTYRYSVCTSKHISYAHNTLNQLGIRFMALEAPRGLDDLESAKRHALSRYGIAMVAFANARIKSRFSIRHYLQQIATLKRCGVRVSASEMEAAIKTATANRVKRLAYEKKRRFDRKIARIVDRVTDGQVTCNSATFNLECTQ